jgi:hypothetical protein
LVGQSRAHNYISLPPQGSILSFRRTVLWSVTSKGEVRTDQSRPRL